MISLEEERKQRRKQDRWNLKVAFLAVLVAAVGIGANAWATHDAAMIQRDTARITRSQSTPSTASPQPTEAP